MFANVVDQRMPHPWRVALSALIVLVLLAGSPVLPVTAAPPDEPDIEWLMVQEAKSGSFVPDGKGGYILTLTEVSPYTIYFSNRPATFAGSVLTEDFTEAFSWSDDNPPNAAVVVQEADAGQDTIIVQLRTPKLDAAAGTLTYSVKVIPDYDGEGLAYHQGRADAAIPKEFGAVSLFIDSVGLSCPSNKSFDCCQMKCGCICGNPLNDLYKCGSISVDSCWYWKPPYGPGCGPCNIKNAFFTCNDRFAACCLANSNSVCWVGCTRMPNPPMP